MKRLLVLLFLIIGSTRLSAQTTAPKFNLDSLIKSATIKVITDSLTSLSLNNRLQAINGMPSWEFTMPVLKPNGSYTMPVFEPKKEDEMPGSQKELFGSNIPMSPANDK